MKKTEFRILIREIVREEVAMAIKEVITELRKPTKSFIKTDSKKKRIEKKKYTKTIFRKSLRFAILILMEKSI